MGLNQNIEIHIEELVLHGFWPNDRYLIGEALEQEISRLLMQQDTAAFLGKTGDHNGLDAGSFDVAPGTGPDAIGALLGRAVYGGLMK